MPELIFTLPDGQTLRRMIGHEPIVVGRDSSCDMPIDDPSASRRHARFTWSSDGYFVEDLGSKNGTLVNDEPCAVRPLQDRDQVLIGSTLAVFSDAAPQSTQNVVIAEEEPTSHATRYVSGERRLLIPQQRLEILYELSEQLTTLQDRDGLLEGAMKICCDTLHFERGAIGVRPATGRGLDWPVVHHLRGAEGELRISRTLLNRALEHGERAIFTEDDAGHSDPTVSMVQQGIRSAMCVPLVSSDGILGVIYGDRTSTSTTYTDEDIDFFAGIARQVSIGLINCRLVDEQRAMERLRHEIDLARRIQTGLFPKVLPSDDAMKFAAVNDPGQRISGDYYDVIDAGNRRTWCLMADVTGEGVAAALLMANLQAAVRMTIHDVDDPGALLSRWNRLIFHNTGPSKFITCTLALLDAVARKISVSSAGHSAPLLVRSNPRKLEEVELETGYPLGVVDDVAYETRTIDVGEEPFVYFCYTDGVTEAMNPEGDQFGSERLFEALSASNDHQPDSLVKHVRKAVAKFAGGAAQSDDITILAGLVS